MKMFDRKILLCVGTLLFIASCGLFRPKIHLYEFDKNPMIAPCDTTKYGYDRIMQEIYRYQQNDTLLYEYRCVFERPEYFPFIKISKDPDFFLGGRLYTHYAPSSRSGILGMTVREGHPKGIELPGGSELPLYRFQIDTVIRYRYMSSNERKEDLKNNLYRASREYYNLESEFFRFYNLIWSAYYEAAYHYYDKRDSILYIRYGRCRNEDNIFLPTENLGMCYFPVEKVKINYYVKKRLMKRFLGFCIIDDTIKAQYLQEVDTALLALPTKHFIREFLRTEQLDCLDRKTFPLPQKQPHAPPETAIP